MRARDGIGTLGRLQRTGLRLFPRFGEPGGSVQRMVGVIGGAGTIIVGIINALNFGYAEGLTLTESLLSSRIGLIFVLGLMLISCGFWDHVVARSVHIGLFVFSGIFGALSATRGNITSSFFLVFAIILLLEYGASRGLTAGLAVLMLAGYVVALSVGYSDDVARPVVTSFSSLVTVLVFVGLFIGVTFRHRLLLHANAVELESRIRERTAELNQALSERTVMLQEIHHRVKNNLQTIYTLLGMETDRISDPEARQLLTSSRQRIQAMAGVHDALYKSDRLDQVDLSAYVRDLVDTILQASVSPVELDLDVRPTGPGDLSFAVSLGLALNELVSNAQRHGFENAGAGRLRIALFLEAGEVVLEVGDDGRGLPDGFDLSRDGRVGMTVVNSIASRRGGSFATESGNGTRCFLRLPFTYGGG